MNNNVIDNIIEAKTDYTPYDFTGGNIQYSVSKYTKTMTISLVLYFGFNATRNPISKKFEIDKKDVSRFCRDLEKRTEYYLNHIVKKKESEKLSYECITNSLRGAPNGSGNIDSVDSVDSDSGLSEKSKISPNEEMINDFTEQVWSEHRQLVSKYRSNYGSKGKAVKKMRTIIKKIHSMTSNSLEDVLTAMYDYIASIRNGEYTANLEKLDAQTIIEVIEGEE